MTTGGAQDHQSSPIIGLYLLAVASPFGTRDLYINLSSNGGGKYSARKYRQRAQFLLARRKYGFFQKSPNFAPRIKIGYFRLFQVEQNKSQKYPENQLNQ